MKFLFTFIIIITALNCTSQIAPDVTVYSSLTGTHKYQICSMNFRNVKINNHYLSLSVCDSEKDSIQTDTLVFGVSGNTQKIKMRNISFSRKGQIFCSADSFPIRDSAKWKLSQGSHDSLVLRDSLLYLRFISSNYRTVQWLLKQKYVFCKGDTFKLLLDTLPEINVVDRATQFRTPLTPTHIQKSKKLMLLGKESGSLAFQEQAIMPIFDLFGKKHSTSPEGSALYVIPSLKGNE